MQNTQGSLQLTVKRKPQFFLFNPPIHTVVDQHPPFALEKKGSRVFSVEPGAHLVSFNYRILGVERVTIARITMNANATVTVAFNRSNDLMDVECSAPVEIIEQR